MPDARRKHCRVCGGHESEVGPISWRGLCAFDGMARNVLNYDHMQARSGPFYEHWVRRCYLSAVRQLREVSEANV